MHIEREKQIHITSRQYDLKNPKLIKRELIDSLAR